MKIADLQNIATGIGRPIAKKISELEARLARLESGEYLTHAYRGAWRKSLSYQRGQLATHSGSLWLAEAATEAQPGTTPDWRLVSKNGSAPQ